MSVQVLAPGLATSLQAAPRSGLRFLGVAACGALDPWSQALANLLVGNAPQTATLELTLTGPTLRFEHGARIALCGGGFDMDVDGVPLADARLLALPAGSVLRIGRARHGARGYLAVRGGFRVRSVLGSDSTDLRGGFGGHQGRLLRAGDRLRLAASAGNDIRRLHMSSWWIEAAPDAGADESCAVVRVLPGVDATVPEDALFAGEWTVTAASNRQGLRLAGTPLALRDTGERLSEPVAPGSIQLPADGQPIILLADAQTHGGYPRIGHAIRADWPALAQLRPGQRLRLRPCTRDEAFAALARQRHRLHRLAIAIGSKRTKP